MQIPIGFHPFSELNPRLWKEGRGSPLVLIKTRRRRNQSSGVDLGAPGWTTGLPRTPPPFASPCLLNSFALSPFNADNGWEEKTFPSLIIPSYQYHFATRSVDGKEKRVGKWSNCERLSNSIAHLSATIELNDQWWHCARCWMVSHILAKRTVHEPRFLGPKSRFWPILCETPGIGGVSEGFVLVNDDRIAKKRSDKPSSSVTILLPLVNCHREWINVQREWW